MINARIAAGANSMSCARSSCKKPASSSRMEPAWISPVNTIPSRLFIIVSGAPGLRSASAPRSMPSTAMPASMSCLRRSRPAFESSRSKSSCNCSSVRFIPPRPFRPFSLSYAIFPDFATRENPQNFRREGRTPISALQRWGLYRHQKIQQAFASTFAIRSCRAPVGQACAHAPQPTHFS